MESGLYLRTLSRRESVSLIASTVLEHLMAQARFEEAAAVSEILLRHNPRCAFTLLNQASAYLRILHRDFLDKYRMQCLIPIHLQPRYQLLWSRNHAAVAAARALGWEDAPRRQ